MSTWTLRDYEREAVAERHAHMPSDCGGERQVGSETDVCARMKNHRGDHMTERHLNFLVRAETGEDFPWLTEDRPATTPPAEDLEMARAFLRAISGGSSK